jgi:uncharacterized protein YdiU (UPF0061 family)
VSEGGVWESAAEELRKVSSGASTEGLGPWLQSLCRQLQAEETEGDGGWLAQMRGLNPAYTLRSAFVRRVTAEAAEGRYAGVQAVLAYLQHPFEPSRSLVHDDEGVCAATEACESGCSGDEECRQACQRAKKGLREGHENSQTSCGGQ